MGRQAERQAEMQANQAPGPRPIGQYRYYDFVMAAFVAILLLSNVLGAGKVAQIWLPAGVESPNWSDLSFKDTYESFI